MLVVCPQKLSYFPRLDFLDFLHAVKGPKSKKTDTAGFSKKNLKYCAFWVFMVKIEVFRTLRENATVDFAHFAYLDRSHQYLQLLY